MILIDTSAWIEFLRDTGSSVCNAVDELLDDDIATCDVVAMELLAGARDDNHLQSLRALLARATHITVLPIDYEDAAGLYRTSRRRGVTVRKLADCLIGAVAIRAGATVLHSDSDFNLLASCSSLVVDQRSSRRKK